jgi:hypothetical protein
VFSFVVIQVPFNVADSKYRIDNSIAKSYCDGESRSPKVIGEKSKKCEKQKQPRS